MPISSHDLQQSRQYLPKSAIGCAPIVLGTPLSKPSRWIYVGTTGSLILNFIDGSTATFTTVPVGLYNFAVSLVATG